MSCAVRFRVVAAGRLAEQDASANGSVLEAPRDICIAKVSEGALLAPEFRHRITGSRKPRHSSTHPLRGAPQATEADQLIRTASISQGG